MLRTFFLLSNVPNINKFGAAKRPNIEENQGPRGRGVYLGGVPGNDLS